jgi:hypothetical protein
MSKKKRRKRPAPLRPPEAEVAADRADAGGRGRGRDVGRRTATTGAMTGGQRTKGKASPRSDQRPRRPRTPEERSAAAAQWAHPPLAPSVARGLRAVGSSPLLVVSALLATLALWLIFTAYGAAPAPSAMVLLTALPPAHSLLDIEAVLTGGSSAPGATLVFLAGLLVVRAALISLWVAGSLQRLTQADPHDVLGGDAGRGGVGELSIVMRRAMRSFSAVLGVEAGFYVISMAIALATLQSAALQIAVIGALVGGLLFFIYAPIVVVAEEVGLGPAVRLSIKAARLPGPRHMLATVAYIAMTLTVSLFAPTSRVAAATPTITVWLFVLFVTFLHVTALATFVYRWLVIRGRVIGAPADRPDGNRERPAPAALR